MIREFILRHWKSKLDDRPSLLIYDADRRYEQLLTGLEDGQTKIFNISTGVLGTREDALDYYTEVLPSNDSARMVLYIPYPPPMTKQQQVLDPYYIFSLGGHIFPYDAADRYESLCRACFRSRDKEISALFEQEIPSFDTIDTLGEGHKWGKLQTTTGGKSEKEILLTLLAPKQQQASILQKDHSWIKEYKSLAQKIGLPSKARTFDQVNNELWFFVLISEFIYDLPVNLPAALKNVPIANETSRHLMLDLCHTLRNTKSCQDLYVTRAEAVSAQLTLPDLFKNETDLGEIITFSFEDNTYFRRFVDLLTRHQQEEARQMIANSKENIWLHHDEERRHYWKLAEIGMKIIEWADRKEGNFNKLKELIEFYNKEGYKIDQFQRRFEKQLLEVLEINKTLAELVKFVRGTYKRYAEQLQKKYQQLFGDEPWPVEGLARNIQVFSKYIQPLMNAGIRTAYLMVDAFRLELARELEELIKGHFSIEIFPSCAYLPTVTKFGMCALLPDADKNLTLDMHLDSLEAFMEGKPLLNLANRKDYMKTRLGDRCEILSLEKAISLPEIPQHDLLVLTTNEIDNAGENLETNALLIMHQAIQKLMKATYLLKQAGYDKIVLASDHGFVIRPEFHPGDNVSKPAGEWSLKKSRALAGKGASAPYCLSFSPQHIGTRSPVSNFIFLKNYAVFEKNTNYFHEGLSLQENIVPVMVISGNKATREKKISFSITYKGKSSGSITTRRPMIEISSFLEEEELQFDPVILRIEVMTNSGVSVGSLAPNEHMNEVGRLLEIFPGQACKIPINMQPDFEGEFDIWLSDPVTGKLFASITLKTDYIS